MGDFGNSRGQEWRNDGHESRTAPDAKLYRKSTGSEAKLIYLGQVMLGNPNGPIVEAMVTEADGKAETDAALLLAHNGETQLPSGRITLGADIAYEQGKRAGC